MADVANLDPIGAFVDGPLAQARLGLVTDCTLRLIAYRDSYATLAALPNGAAALAERARDAENDLRVVLRCGLDILNDFYDMAATAIAAINSAKVGPSLDADQMFVQVTAMLEEQKIELDPKLLTELRAALVKVDIKMTVGNSYILVESGGDKHELSFDRRPGDLGRVAASTFFAKVGDRVRLVDSAVADPDHRHDAQTIGGTAEKRVDCYGSAITAFALGRDFMAQHSAVTAYFGRPHVLAHSLFLGVILAICGIPFIIAGGIAAAFCKNNNTACTVANVLLSIGGVALLVGVASIVGAVGNIKQVNFNSISELPS